MPKSSRRNFKKYSKKRKYRNSRNTKYRNNKKQTLKKKKRRKTKMKGGSKWIDIKEKINRTNFYDVVNQAKEFNISNLDLTDLSNFKLTEKHMIDFVKNNKIPDDLIEDVTKSLKKIEESNILSLNIISKLQQKIRNFLGEICNFKYYCSGEKKEFFDIDADEKCTQIIINPPNLTLIKVGEKKEEGENQNFFRKNNKLLHLKIAKGIFYQLLLLNLKSKISQSSLDSKLNVQCVDVFYPLVNFEETPKMIENFNTHDKLNRIIDKYSELSMEENTASEIKIIDILKYFIIKKKGTALCDNYTNTINIKISEKNDISIENKDDSIENKDDLINNLKTKIAECKKDKKKFIIIYLNLLFNGGGHANYLIIDTKNLICYRIEPHGYKDLGTRSYKQESLDKFLDDEIINKLENKDLKYLNLDTSIIYKDKNIFFSITKTLTGAQTVTQNLSTIGMCNTWGLYLTILCILYPKYTMDTINKLVILDNPHLRILKFMIRMEEFYKNKDIPTIDETTQEAMIKYEMFDLRENYPPNSFIQS